MIALTEVEYKKHFFGKPYASFAFEAYGFSKTDFGETQYKNIVDHGYTYAIYPLTDVGTCSYIVFDFDGEEGKAESVLPVVKEFKKYLEGKEIKCTVFFSGNKGYHVYLFFDSTIKAIHLRMFADNLLREFNQSFQHDIKIEIFPKQVEVNYAKKKYGNHLKAPLSTHPKTGRKSVQISDYLENSYLIINQATEKLFDKIDFEVLTKTLAPYFVDGSRHNITLGVAGYFKQNGVEKKKTEDIFDRIIELSGGDKSDIFRVIEDTYTTKKLVADLSFANLPTKIENIIFSFISGLDTEELKFQINQIRSTKKQSHIKVDLSAQKAIEYINTRYRIFKDSNFIYIIYGDKVYTTFDRSFDSLMLHFGLNVEESFARQVRRAIIDYYFNNAPYSKPINYSEYIDEKINIYTHTSIIRLSKEDIIDDLEFMPVLNKKLFSYIPSKERAVKLRDVLSSFKLSRQNEDIILSWLVSQFFNEGINTKPVLLIQGKPGSGKSTLANMLLKLVENRDSKVSAYTGKDDALIAALQKHRVLVLDNLEYITGKTIDLINAIVTGAAIELRALYTTNEIVQIVPQCSLVITSAHGNFDNDGAFQSRLMRVRLSDRNQFMVESEFWQAFDKNYNCLVSEILDLCLLILRNKNYESKNYRIRMTDYIDICSILLSKNVISTNVETTLLKEQMLEKINNPYFKIYVKVAGQNNIYKPFKIDNIFAKFRSIATHNYGLDKITASNLGSKLLKTGLFSMDERGIYMLNSLSEFIDLREIQSELSNE